MEIFGVLEVPVFVVAIATILFSVCLYTWYKQSYFTRLGIQTKQTTFFLGDLPQVIKKGFGYIDGEMVEKEGKVFGAFIGNTGSLVVNDPDMLKQILVKEFANFTDKVIFPIDEEFESAISVASGTEWKFLRHTLSPMFTTGKMKNMSPLISRCLKKLNRHLDVQIKKHPEGFDLYEILKGHILDLILVTCFGMEIDAIENPDNDFVKTVQNLLKFNPGSSIKFLLIMFFPDLMFLFGRISFVPAGDLDFLRKALASCFDERKKDTSPNKDLLQIMIHGNKGSSSETMESDTGSEGDKSETIKKRGLTETEVFINTVTFMSAGYETTAVTLGWCFYYINLYPECQERLIEEIDTELGKSEPNFDNVSKLQYLDMVVNETLRMASPVPRQNRMAKDDIVINGVPIKKDMDVTYSPLALHYCSDYWEKPYKFDPERFSPENKHKINEYAFLPFGTGPRGCLGMRLALFKLKATIVSLLQHFRFEKADSFIIPMPAAKGGVRGLDKPLNLKVIKRETTQM